MPLPLSAPRYDGQRLILEFPMDTPLLQPRGRPSPGNRLRVLIVDDNAVNREVATALLESWGALTFEAANGAVAVQLVVQGQDFDIVLMDVQMPVMDGLAATAHIRQFERDPPRASAPRLPIVAITSEDLPTDEVHLRQLGLDALLRKPLSSTSLRLCLERWCPGTLESS